MLEAALLDAMLRYSAAQWDVLDRYNDGTIQVQELTDEEFRERVGDRAIAQAMVFGDTYADIYINVERDYSRSCLLRAIMHEMGHAAGVMEHSESRNDIMYYQSKTRGNCDYMMTERDAQAAGIPFTEQPLFIPPLLQDECVQSVALSDALDLTLTGVEYQGALHTVTMDYAGGDMWALSTVEVCE